MVTTICNPSPSQKTWIDKTQETIMSDQDVDKDVPNILYDIVKTNFKFTKVLMMETKIKNMISLVMIRSKVLWCRLQMMDNSL